MSQNVHRTTHEGSSHQEARPARDSSDDRSDDLPGGTDAALTAAIASDEQVQQAMCCPEGVERVVDGETRPVADEVVLAATDRRVLLLTVAEEPADVDVESVSLSDLGAVVLRRLPPVLELVTTDHVSVRVSLPLDAVHDPPSLVPHLRWLGEVRGRVLATRADVEGAVEEIRAHAAADEYERATAKYERARKTVDRVIDTVQRVEPVDDEVLAPELTDLDRSLEAAAARTHLECAYDRLEFARDLIHAQSFDRARTILAEARASSDRAKGRVAAVSPGDSDDEYDLTEDIRALEWELETVAAEPLRLAEQARTRGERTEDPAARIAHLETAHSHYQTILPEEGYVYEVDFGGDVSRIESASFAVGEQLVDAYREYASELMSDTDGEAVPESPVDTTDAGACLTRAHELAREFDPDAITDIEYTLEFFVAE